MRITGFHTILIQVSNMRRALAFWRDGLGVAFETEHEDGAVTAKLGDVLLTLHPDLDASLKRAKKRGAGIAIHLRVEDVDAFHAQLVKRGVPVEGPPEDRPWGREFGLVDPDGYTVEVLGPRKRNPR